MERSRSGKDSHMGKWLRNPKHERFARAIVFDGTHPAQAYIDAGFEPNRANHNRLIRHPDVKARIADLTRERETAARAARTPIAEVLAELGRCGLDRVADFFESGPDGELVVRDVKMVRVEVALALLNALHDGVGMNWDRSGS
jgi:hypothetical protein